MGRNGDYPPGMLQHAQALALRRAALTTAALAATVAAHHAATGHTAVYAGAPALWLGFAALATLLGPRARRFRPRGTGTCLVLLLVAQLSAHAVLTHAPWALGLAGHPEAVNLSAGALVAHAAAAVLLTLLLTGVDAALADLCGIVRRLARLLPAVPRRGTATAAPVVCIHQAWTASPPPSARAPRGPPRPVVA